MVDIQKNGLIQVLPGHEVFNEPVMCHVTADCETAIPFRAAAGFDAGVRSR
jgi:hypothetical protein